ncbi:DUF6392 family protein [Pseudomonas chlororaphis]|uniref:DUF6392 family protein n=1 Tax=Pseudomonas chlororaphis TaxID=587753 RepID=UPI002D776796|nr:DUF6392 family protein [Pseudomonas chlororaphis]
MDSATLERWISNLGKSHDAMVAQGVISNQPLQDLYDSGDSLEIEPEPGIELSFWAETKRFEAIQITLRADPESGMAIYAGTLPAPYSAAVTQLEVRNAFGTPVRTVGPIAPPGMKKIGGWDSFQLPSSLHPEALVDFQYSEDLQVDRVVFALIDRS